MLRTCVRFFQLLVICMLTSRLEKEVDQTVVGFGEVLFFSEIKQTKSGLSSVSSFLIFCISAKPVLDLFRITVEFELFTTLSYTLCQVLEDGIEKKKIAEPGILDQRDPLAINTERTYQHQLWLKRHLLTIKNEGWHWCGKTGLISPHLLFHKLCVCRSDTKKDWGIFIYVKASFSLLFCLLKVTFIWLSSQNDCILAKPV